MKVHFEHIAIAVHEEDFAAWYRLLRGSLGGTASMGGDAAELGFHGVQVSYPCGGMLELISWTVPRNPDSPIVKYVERHGPRAALHHLTFLVDSLDGARERCRELGYEFMQGRDDAYWKEIYLRAPFLEPPKMLIQVLEADKEMARAAAGDAVRVDSNVSTAAAATRIAGVRVACSDAEAATALFCGLLGAHAEPDVLTWPGSTMRIELVPGASAGDSHIVIVPPAGVSPLDGEGVPAEADSLVRHRGLA
jgi:catechol 2,3-dioxygenase-like lactoylglutathione lyase family enzyme